MNPLSCKSDLCFFTGTEETLEIISNTKKMSGNGTLNFNPTLKQHEGKYLCEIDNGAGEILKKVISLTVHGRIIFQRMYTTIIRTVHQYLVIFYLV